MVDTYKNLASAIVLQAIKDWEKSVKVLKTDPKDKASLAMKKDCEEFFNSDWFEELLEISEITVKGEDVKEMIYGHQRLS